MNRRTPGAYLLLLILCVVALFPIYWMVKTSLTPEGSVYRTPPSVLIQSGDLELGRYQRIWHESPVGRWLLNTMLVGIVTSLLCILVSVPAAYALSRFRFRWGIVAGYSLLVTRMMPLTLLIIPMYMIFARVGLLNKLFSIIIADLAYILPFSVWILKGFFDGIPAAVDESAEIDGCSTLRILHSIILPLSLPGIGAAVLYSFVRVWSEFLFVSTFMTSPENFTVTVGAQLYAGSLRVSWGDIMAVTTLGSLPMVALFLYLEKYFVSGLAAGAVKE
ncbi:carbohydrate ABC transporter permease [Geochorda subterranea]|uniref:Carbohydrate ABC transporter permease n=1 Tax=Geochorda subterranea TaxID=3109564 RepID=A0ABZ1BMP6_9FIRM|nr:carbohydrate ABC transporter permease [Limnochorda sp. LNt]WRP13768.1 carbohydrate ABC transporter permease [Limnochorda sp. LNt]